MKNHKPFQSTLEEGGDFAVNFLHENCTLLSRLQERAVSCDTGEDRVCCIGTNRECTDGHVFETVANGRLVYKLNSISNLSTFASLLYTGPHSLRQVVLTQYSNIV